MSTAADVIVIPGSGKLSRVSRDSRWREIADELIDGVRSGRWPVGEHMPPMRELAETFHTSRGTIQRAVRWLIAVGVAESRHGSGVVVISQEPEEPRTVAEVLDDHEERIAALEVELRRLRRERGE